METFVTNIKKSYHDGAINYDEEHWPPNKSGKLLRLELVTKKKGEHFFALSRQSFKQALIAYNDLFKSGTKKVLVEGSTGIGKTSLCISISKDWANGELFQEYKLLLLLPLHQKKMALASSLSKLLENFMLQDTPSIINHLEESKGEGVLMIADGWDKLGESERRKGSFFYNLLFGGTLSLASVLVTSRPTASAPLHRDTCIDRFIEVRGFKKRSLEDYVQSETHEGTSNLILEQLDYNPLMESTCKVPFVCTIICHSLWQTFEKALPPTMTEVSTKLILNVLCNYVWKGGTPSLLSLSEVDTLPESLLDSLRRLCQLAFEMLTVDRNQIDLSHSKSGIESAGLLEIITERNNVFFHFLHPMFQEYLAALHVVKQPHTSQLRLLDAIKSQQFTMFWQYFFGICMEYDQKDIIEHTIHMLSTSTLSKSLLCHCAFEAKNDDITNKIIKALILKSERSIHFGDPNTAYACTAILYIIDRMQTEGLDNGMEINFKGCNLDSRIIGKLADILAKRQDQFQVRSLDLSDNNLPDDSVANLFHRASSSFQLLKKLFLRNNKIGGESITAIVTALAKPSSQNVVQLDLSFNPLTLTGLQKLWNAIKSDIFAKLEILFMQGALTTDASINLKYFSAFTEVLLSHCQQLRRLDMSGNSFGEPESLAISRIILRLISFTRNLDLQLNKEYMPEVDKCFIAKMGHSVRRKGTIDHTIAHGVIVGPGRSGKNSLMNRLMGEGPPDPDTISPSTGVLESVIKVEIQKLCTVAVAVNNLIWKRLDYDEEALEFMMTTAKYDSASNYVESSVLKVGDTGSQLLDAPIVVVKEPITNAQIVHGTAEVSKKAKEPSPFMDNNIAGYGNSSESGIIVHERPLDIFKRAMKLRRMDALREHLESSWSLYLTNTGGQMEFQELLPLIVCGPSVFFITFPLDKNLHEHYTVQYQYKDGSEKTYPSPSTLMDEILQTLATIAALDCTGPQHDVNLKPKVFFVGTHKDKIPESSVIIQKIDKQLQKEVRQTSLFRQGSIEFAVGTKQLMFAVNNLDKSDSDFQKIRSALQQSVERSKEFTIKCPSTWLVFSLVLRAKHKSSQILSYNDCFTIAQSCGITDRTELNNALFFIHSRLGLVRYFCVEELNNLVVIDPQILFDKITKLIVETFISDHANVSEIEEFQKRGIFSTRVMERINKKSQTESDTQLPFKWLLNLLDHLRIAAFFTDHKGDRKCFFPAVLCHAPKRPIQSIEYNDWPIKPPPPILIAFKSGFCPRGIPEALIKYLMTNEMKSDISWKLYPTRVFRNQVSFGVGPCGIMLTIQPTHLEVSFDPESDAIDESEIKETCEETFIQLQQAMKDITKGYRECDYFFTFNCTRPECKRRPHPAEMDWSTKKLKCAITDQRTRLPVDYQLWIRQKKSFSPHDHQGSLDLVLDADGVPKHLGQIADTMYEWEGPVAEQLGLTPADVAAIKIEYPGELRLQTRVALVKWKQKLGSSATYNNLIGVFERAGYNGYADMIRKLFEVNFSASYQEDPSLLHASPLPQLPVFPQYEPSTQELDSLMSLEFENLLEEVKLDEITASSREDYDGFLHSLEESIEKKGKIDHTVVHGVFLGPGRSGKNSLMNRLLGDGPLDQNTTIPSTGVAESVVKVEISVCTIIDELIWKKLKYDQEAVELMMSTVTDKPNMEEEVETESNNDEHNAIPETDQYLEESSTNESKNASLNAVPMPTTDGKPHEHSGSTNDYESFSESEKKRAGDVFTFSLPKVNPLEIFKRAIKSRQMDGLREHLESSWSLYLTNTGGQMEFQELLPFVISGPSLFFVTIPLHKKLDEHYTVEYLKVDGSKREYESPSTLIEEILRILATISALGVPGPQRNNLKPIVFLVGTHKDEIKVAQGSSVENHIQEIDSCIRQKIEQTSLYKEDLLEFACIDDDKEQLIFTANNLAKSDHDFQVIRKAVQRSVKRAKSSFTVRSPSTWLIFSLVLRAKYVRSNQVLSYRDCYELAQRCGISDEDEFDDALVFIHSRLGLVRYFKAVNLQQYVVIDPQILFDKITDLIVKTFIEENAYPNEIQQFRKRGIFFESAIKRIWAQNCSTDLQKLFDWLLNLLTHLKIASFFKDKNGVKACFFPSVICHATEAPESDDTTSTDSTQPLPPALLIAFESGLCPNGIAVTLITSLMRITLASMANAVHWVLRSKRIYKYQVSFGLPGHGDIILKMLPTHIEVCLDSTDLTMNKIDTLCEEAYKLLKQAMEYATEGYQKCGYKFTFYCTRPKCIGKSSQHPAQLQWCDNCPSLRCLKEDRDGTMPEGFEKWKVHNDSTTDKSHVELTSSHDLLNQVVDFKLDAVPIHLGQIAKLMCDWRGSIADELELTPAEVTAIENDNICNLEQQKRAALFMWKQKHGDNATYNKLIVAFERAEHMDYADKVKNIVKEYHKSQCTAKQTEQTNSPKSQSESEPKSSPKQSIDATEAKQLQPPPESLVSQLPSESPATLPASDSTGTQKQTATTNKEEPIAEQPSLKDSAVAPSTKYTFSCTMTPSQLGQWLLQVYGADYQEDIDKLTGRAKINGELFLELPECLDEILKESEIKINFSFKKLILKKAKQLS